MLIYVQFVISKDIIPITLDPSCVSQATATVLVLKGKIRDDTGFRLDMMQLTNQDEERLCDQCNGEGTLLRLAIKAPEYSSHPSQQSYAGFLGSTQFLNTAGHAASPPMAVVPSSLAIVLQSTRDPHRSQLDLQSLLELVEGDNSSVSMKQTFGYAEAKKRGFIQWTSSHLVYERVMLLEVERGDVVSSGSEGASVGGEGQSDKFREKERESARGVLESRRYRYDGITHLYRGGDRHSWQRYTRHTPVPCSLSLDPALQQLTISPKEPLKPGKEYVVLLRHGGKLVCGVGDGVDEEGEGDSAVFPASGGSGVAGVISSGSNGQLEGMSDHLIFFTTAPSSPSPSPLIHPSSSPQNKQLQQAQPSPSTSLLLHQVSVQLRNLMSLDLLCEIIIICSIQYALF